MLAARVHAWSTPPVLDDLPEPQPGSGEVLVEVAAATLSHLDVSVASGTFGMHPQLPYIGGLEASGSVISGDDIATGTQVLVRGGGLGLLRDGTWAERICVPRKAVTVLPPGLAPEVAATFFQPTSTAYVALHDVGNVQPGETVIVMGAAGAVGAQVVQQALLAGAEVIGVVGRADQVDWIPAGAATAVADDECLARLADERPATLLVDTLGGAQLSARLGWVRPGGRAVVVGYVAGASVELDLPTWLLAEVALLPVNMIRNEPRARELAPRLIGQLLTGELYVDVERFAMADIADGLSRLREGKLRGRAVVCPTAAIGNRAKP